MKRIDYESDSILGSYGLVYLKEELVNKSKTRMGLFRCLCGKEFISYISQVKQGKIKNCGCGINSNYQKHGMTGTKIRRCWNHIKQRCYNINHINYKWYGARGIKMYAPWVHDFKAFYDYVSKLEHFNKKEYSIDRIDNDGNYEPGNLRWITQQEQLRNKRLGLSDLKVDIITHILLTYKNKELKQEDLVKIFHVKPYTLLRIMGRIKK